MPGRRWGAQAPADVDEARERLIDAADRCVRRWGVDQTTVEAVAREANVSRATVYRYIRSRDDLLWALLLRGADDFFLRLGRVMAGEPDIGRAIVRGVLAAVDEIRRSDLLRRLFVPLSLASTMGALAPGAFDLTRRFATPYFDRAAAEGRLRPGLDQDEALEWILRLGVSLLMVESPVERSPQEQARFLSTYLLPALLVDAGRWEPGSLPESDDHGLVATASDRRRT